MIINTKILFGFVVLLLTFLFSISSLAMPCHDVHGKATKTVKNTFFQYHKHSIAVLEAIDINSKKACETCIGTCIVACNPSKSHSPALFNSSYKDKKEFYNNDTLFYKARYKLYDFFYFTSIPLNSVNKFRVLLI